MSAQRSSVSRLLWLSLLSLLLLTACIGKTVTKRTLQRVDVTPASVAIAIGTQQQFTATAVYSDSTHEDVTASVRWTSFEPAVATISASGLASAVDIGLTTIFADFQGLTGAATLVVSPATVTSIAVTPTAPSAAKGTSRAFTAVATFSDKTTQDITTSATWSSSNTSIATISNDSGSNGLAQALAVGSTTITASYLSQTGSTTLSVTPATLSSIAVTPTAPSIGKGSSRQFTAVASFSDASTQDVTSAATWSSSDTSIATISNSAGSNGLAQSLAIGSTTISASYNGQSGSTTLTVTAATVTRIGVTPAQPSIAKGTRQQFTAVAVFSDSSTQDVTVAATWTAADSSIASISNAAGSNGLAQALAAGSTAITASYGGQDGSTTLTVTPAMATALAITPSDPSIAKGTTQAFTAVATFSDSSTQDVTTTTTWFSSDTGIATISNASGSNGLAQSVNTGSATITASYGGQTASTTLSVTPAVISRIDVTPSSPSIAQSTSLQFAATAVFTDNSTQDVTTASTWSSSDTSVATISNASGSNGRAQSLSAGSTTITAQYLGQSGSTGLTVTNATLASIAVTPDSPSVANGFTQQFRATGTYSDSTTQDLTDAVTWASTSTGVATISNAAGSNGLAQSVNPGATTITATLNGISGSTSLTVTAAILQSITIAPASGSVPAGYQRPYSATGSYSDGTSADLTRQVSWSTDNAAVATILSAGGADNGLLSGVAPGTAGITASLGAISQTVAVTVSNATLQSLSVSPANATLRRGQTQQYLAFGQFSDGLSLALTTQVTWTSSNTAVATISNAAGSKGLATVGNLAIGSTTISASRAGVTGSTSATVPLL